MLQKLHHVAYRCRDAAETVEFYTKVIGLKFAHAITNDHVPSTKAYSPHIHIFFEMADGSSLAFFDLGDDVAAEPSPNTPRWCNHMALEVESAEHLQQAHRRLTQAGVEVVGPLDHEGFVRSIYFFDPNGARLELTTPTASPEKLAGYRSAARAALEAWTKEKRAKRTRAKEAA